MTFAHPFFLWFLLVPTALVLAAALRRARTALLSHPKIPRARLNPNQGSLLIGFWSPSSRPFAAGLALAGLLLALARPQGATLSTPSYTQSRDVIVAVDVSRSMLAEDISPTRLARAQLLIRNLADELRGERLGLLPFAGTAFLQSPLSADYEIFRTFLDELGPEMIPAGGSNFASLLRTADEAFGPPDSTAPDAPPPADRYLIILSDGEAQDDSWRPFADTMAKRGVQVLSLGLGTSEGAMVPDGNGALVKDERGAVVLSRLNPATLQELARLTNGAYRDASAWVDVPALLRETISRGRATRSATDTAPRRQELFLYFLVPSLALLALALLREFPAAPRHSAVSAKILHPSPARLARAALIAFSLHVFSDLPTPAFAAAPASPPPDPLVELVGKLASAPELPPADLARLATLTAERGEKKHAAPDSAGHLPESAIHDAVAAVTAGQAAAPTAADWPALRQRLDALLAPPPQPPKSDQTNKPQKSEKSDDSEKSDQSSPSENSDSSDPSQDPGDDQKSAPRPSDSPPPESPPSEDASSQPEKGENTPDSQSGAPSSSDSKTPPDGEQKEGSTTKPSGEKPLGDLAQPGAPDAPEPPEEKPSPSPSDSPPSEDSADAPTQTVGGVSASGRPDDPASDSATAALDPALMVPRQRLDRVRDSDAPARFFQLLQDAELPPDSPERRAAGNKHDW